MKYVLLSIPVFFLSLFVYSKLAGPIPFTITSTTTNKTDTFVVTGEGKTTITPDIARITAGVVSQAATVKQAQTQLNATINTVTNAIKHAGIAAKDLKTSNYSINPQYDYANGKQRITGYQAHSSLLITIRNLDSVNTVIDTATANGATEVGNVSFDTEDKIKAENEARMLAVADAKNKAENAARIAGFQLGRVINYQEQTNGYNPQPRLYAAKRDTAMIEAATQIEPGSSELTMTVTLSYDIK